MLLGFLLPTILLSRTLLRETPRTLRWRGRWRSGRAWAGALVFGAGLAALVLAFGTVVGGAAWTGDGGTAAAWGSRALELAVLFAPAALAEEVIFRGLPLVTIARHTGRAVAALAMALLFALAHWGNPGASALGLANIGIAGLWLTAAFYAPGGLWTAFGAHLGWNWALAVLDAPVSGFDLNIPLIDYFPGGPRWLTGGWFGPEGGLIGTLGLLAGTALVVWYLRRIPAPVPQELTPD
jgi:membrane protease YdiL (CAAX protease family)